MEESTIKRHYILPIIIAVLICISFCACSSENVSDNDSSSVETESAKPNKSFADIIAGFAEEEHIDFDDAYEQLQGVSSTDGEAYELYQQLTELKNCSGRFVQQSEDSGNRYIADVTFYLSSGKIYFSIDYTGYMGVIKDAPVTESKQTDYKFEAFPKGDLYGREQDFKIYFGNEKLYISWADTCEYTLTRGNGSADGVQEHRENLEESGLLTSITSKIDELYSKFDHKVIYEENDSALYIIICGSEKLRTYLANEDAELLESWQGIEDNAAELSKTLYGALHSYVDHVYIYWVDTIKTTALYERNETLLQAENGTVKYNVVDDNNADSSYTYSKKADYSNKSSHTPSSGERNALKAAQDYLAFSAFSFSGLVEQLKFEGYSNAEANYAAENCGADWNQQAVKAANQYLDTMAFSKSELIEQLEFEGFTHSQAVYGVEHAY